MEGEASLIARDSNKKLNHDRRRARQREKKRGMVLPARREDGTLDLTPHVASLNMVTEGKYLELGKGFVIKP